MFLNKKKSKEINTFIKKLSCLHTVCPELFLDQCDIQIQGLAIRGN